MICSGAVASKRTPVQFKSAGFAIQPLQTGPVNKPYVSLEMFMPASGGFSANVNVVVQPFSGTVKQYIADTKRQLAAKGWKIARATAVGMHRAVFDYTGQAQGHNLHFYATAIATGRKVYLATATATTALWAHDAARLKACANSLSNSRHP